MLGLGRWTMERAGLGRWTMERAPRALTANTRAVLDYLTNNMWEVWVPIPRAQRGTTRKDSGVE